MDYDWALRAYLGGARFARCPGVLGAYRVGGVNTRLRRETLRVVARVQRRHGSAAATADARLARKRLEAAIRPAGTRARRLARAPGPSGGGRDRAGAGGVAVSAPGAGGGSTAARVRRDVRGGLRALGLARWNTRPEATPLGLGALDIRTVLDVGANRGTFARMARARFPGALIHCFEPLPGPRRELEALRWADGRMTCHPVAPGAQAGRATLREHVDFSPSSSLLVATETQDRRYPKTRRKARREIRCARLDELDRRLAPDVLVELDVQGSEAHVIRGGRRTLGAARAAIIEVSLAPLYAGQPSFEDIVRAAADMGLHDQGNLSQAVAADGAVDFLDAVSVGPR